VYKRPVHAVLEHLKAQDDVILSILRSLEKVHGIEPADEQKEAEEKLRNATRYEEKMVKRWVKIEEKESGLAPVKAPV